MKKRRRQQNRPNKTTALVRRPKQALIRGAPVRFNTTEPALQYLLDSTLLGELALHWSADWLSGLFSITDFPPEWVALIRASIRGGWHEAVYAGADAGVFSSQELWDATGWHTATAASVVTESPTPQEPPSATQPTKPPNYPALPPRDPSTL